MFHWSMMNVSLTDANCPEEQSSIPCPLPFKQSWIATGWHPQKQVTKPYQTRRSWDMGTFRHVAFIIILFSWSPLKLITLISNKSPNKLQLHFFDLFLCFLFVFLFVVWIVGVTLVVWVALRCIVTHTTYKGWILVSLCKNKQTKPGKQDKCNRT